MNRMISYEKKDTPIHKLTGFTKLLFFLIWCFTSALTFDTRVLFLMLILSLMIYRISKTDRKQVGSVFKLIMFFMTVNLICIFLFAPEQGVLIYGTRHELFHIAGRYYVTSEQLFYELNVMLKYFVVIPSVFVFIVTTDPSEFASSLNGVGVPYTIAYSVAISLRYIPDIQDEFHRIRNAQEARGIEMSGKAPLLDRIKSTAAIIFPLIFTTMERIDVVSNAMELRGFGKKKKRTWYRKRALSKGDIAVILGSVLLCTAALVFTYYDGNRFYNPFLKL